MSQLEARDYASSQSLALFRIPIWPAITILSRRNHYNIHQLPLVGAHEGLSGDFGKNSPPAWRLVRGVWISTLKTLPDIRDIKDFRCVSKGERIFSEAMGEKEFQVQEKS